MMTCTHYKAVIKNKIVLYVLIWKYPQDMLNKNNQLAEQHMQFSTIYFPVTPTKLYIYSSKRLNYKYNFYLGRDMK